MRNSCTCRANGEDLCVTTFVQARWNAAAWLALLVGVTACGAGSQPATPTGLEGLRVDDVQPRLLIPGTVLAIEGRSFVAEPFSLSSLRLTGTFDSRPVDASFPAQFVDFETLRAELSHEAIARLGAAQGEFVGQVAASVIFTPDGSVHESPVLPMSFSVQEQIFPVIDDVQSGVAFVNDVVAVTGSGLLLADSEGSTMAVVEGCFTPESDDVCIEVAPTALPVSSEASRERGTFRFSPAIAGIVPGSFEGHVHLENHHANGVVTSSEDFILSANLSPPRIARVDGRGSLGQFIDIVGGGFISEEEGLTIVELTGDFVSEEGSAVAIEGLQLIPRFRDGALVRYVLSDEDDPLGDRIDLRSETGTFSGTFRPIVRFDGDEVQGEATPAVFQIDPVKQVVWLKFNPSYVESLRTYGMRALDSLVRARILEVMRRDYETINVEIREDKPEDFAWFATLEIAGPDPNGYGLLGFDNTFGKDVNNERLYDYIGGINALAFDNGDPGFGGVFVESIFTFSQHPPLQPPSSVANPLFDAIFDPLRPDVGTPVSSLDGVADLPTLDSGASCPANDRRFQIACAVWTLGSIAGSTASHELGHSLGLAAPLGSAFHNLGDKPGRLMDPGGARPFEERAQLRGTPPGQFCVESYRYLRGILPTDAPESIDGRPGC